MARDMNKGLPCAALRQMGAVAPGGTIGAGCRVRLEKLTGAPELNGTRGMVLGDKPTSAGRWQVVLDNGARRAIWPANLVRVEWTEAELAAARKRARDAEELKGSLSRDGAAAAPDDVVAALSGSGSAYLSRCATAVKALSAGRPAEAATLFRDAIALEPRRPEAYLTCGYALAQSGDAAGALAHFERAVGLYEAGSGPWAQALAEAFRLLMARPELARPDWWENTRLLELAEKAAGAGPGSKGPLVWHMVAAILCDEPGLGEPGKRRTPGHYREAALCYARAANKAAGRPEEAELRAEGLRVMDALERHPQGGGKELDVVADDWDEFR